ncbi:DUF3850 domain-containing protein [Aeromonas salmonicida]|uniref:DUF3850 domain-containing protein n=1 Tax=Aeromonas salmonicida TaxID=645 RepID=UPI0038BCD1B5
MKHELKIKPEYFAAIYFGEKTFEIRNNADRNFQVGDTLLLKAWDGEFTGDFVEKVVSYITDFEQKPGYVVLGLVNHREHELLEKFHRTGVAIERAISTGSVLADHPLKSRLELLANHHEREMELAAQLSDATRQCGVMAGLLLEAQRYVRYRLEYTECDARIVMGLICDIDAALAGKLPEPAMPEGWELVEKPNCFVLIHEGRVIASMAGPTAEGTAAILAAVLSGKVPEQGGVNGFHLLREANHLRQEEWDIGSEKVSLSFLGNELAGETGELCNVLKKLERERIGIVGSRSTIEKAATELADVVICADLVARALGINTWDAVCNKFNYTSAKYGLKTMLFGTPNLIKQAARTITPAQEDELVTVLQSIVGGFSDDPAHDAAALLKRITGEVQWTGDSFQLPPHQGGELCATEPPSSSPD